MRIEHLGDSAILVRLGDAPDDASAGAVRDLLAAMNARPLEGVTDVVGSYATVCVHFDASRANPQGMGELMQWVRASAASQHAAAQIKPRELVIPVSYGGPFGPDLADVARHRGLSEEQVITRHSAGRYEVRAIGFVPGFAYLAGLPAELHCPRRVTPRIRVPAGSVGIAGGQTGIYPLQTPGGWQIIGRTPTRMFSPESGSLLAAGDLVRFVRVSADEFQAGGAA